MKVEVWMKPDQARKKLNARLDELLPQIGKIEAHIRHETDPLDKDSQERSQQLENEDVLEALDEAGRRELGQIRRALKRLDDGTYGTCDMCGETISRARLKALPAADHCIHCAEAEA